METKTSLRVQNLTGGVTEAASASEVSEQFSARDVVKQHVDTGVVVRPPPSEI